MADLMNLRELSLYLGHMDLEQIVDLVRAGYLPPVVNGVQPGRSSARWDSAAVDAALDSAQTQKGAQPPAQPVKW